MRWLSLLALAACGGAQASTDVVTAAHQADVAAYAAEELACVAQSATAGEARDCIAQVKQRWCGLGGQLAFEGACGDSGLLTQSTVDVQRSVDSAIAAAMAAGLVVDAGGQ